MWYVISVFFLVAGSISAILKWFQQWQKKRGGRRREGRLKPPNLSQNVNFVERARWRGGRWLGRGIGWEGEGKRGRGKRRKREWDRKIVPVRCEAHWTRNGFSDPKILWKVISHGYITKLTFDTAFAASLRLVPATIDRNRKMADIDSATQKKTKKTEFGNDISYVC